MADDGMVESLRRRCLNQKKVIGELSNRVEKSERAVRDMAKVSEANAREAGRLRALLASHGIKTDAEVK